MRALIIGLSLLAATSALAQQQRPMTPAEMQGAVNAAIAQGNIARSMHIEAEAKLAGVADEFAKAQVRIKELEAKTEPKKE